MAKKKKLKVTIEVVPTQGRTTKKTIKVDSGSSLQEVLKAAGISGTSKNLTLNGKPSNLDAQVTARNLTHDKKVKLRVSERPSGS